MQHEHRTVQWDYFSQHEIFQYTNTEVHLAFNDFSYCLGLQACDKNFFPFLYSQLPRYADASKPGFDEAQRRQVKIVLVYSAAT